MSWEKKMDIIVQRSFDRDYGVDVINDHEFNVRCGGEVIMNVKTIRLLSSHWRVELKNSIMKIFEGKVSKIFLNY